MRDPSPVSSAPDAQVGRRAVVATPPEPDASRATSLDHEARCGSCRMLYAYAQARDDDLLLAAWRQQIAEHLDNERTRREP